MKKAELSDPKRIQQVRDLLVAWLKKNKIDMHELSRAEVMLLREESERKKQAKFEEYNA